MVSVTLKGVNKVRRRLADGSYRVHYYHRASGVKLPDDPASSAFVAKLEELNAPPRSVPGGKAPGSFAALIADYRQAAEFTQLGEKTRYEYGRYLNMIEAECGTMQVRHFQRAHVFGLRNLFQTTPRAANFLIAVLSAVLTYAVDHGHRQDNPALRPKKLRTRDGGHRVWRADAIVKFRQKHAAGTAMRTAFEIGYAIGLREEDMVRLGPQHRTATGFVIKQLKGGEDVTPTGTKDLFAYLDALPAKGLVYITAARGGSFTVNNFRHRWRDAILEADMDGYTYHGLRHTIGTEAAEAGASEREIQAMLGHATPEASRKYTRAASKPVLTASGAAKRDARKENVNRRITANGRANGSKTRRTDSAQVLEKKWCRRSGLN